MCRLLAYLGPPVTLESLLFAPPHSLVRQSYAPRHQRHGRVNADGFGVAWYDHELRPEPARYRRDRPIWSDRSLASFAGLVRSGAVVAALRDATPPAAVEESGSPPFTSGPWLFAHNGAVDGFVAGAGEALRGALSERSRAQIEGDSDSAVVFAVVLDALDAGATAPEALDRAVGTVLAEAPARLNLLLTDGRQLVATAWGDSLFVLDRAGMAAGGVIVASEPSDDSPDWRAVPDGSLVVASPAGLSVGPLAAIPAPVRP